MVPSVEHITQLLHHVATFGVKDAFYCVASPTNLLYVVRVVFPLSVISSHRKILNSVVLSQMRWVYGDEAFPNLERFESKDFGWARSRDAVMLTFKLWKALSEAILTENEPWPRSHYIRPRLIYIWNLIKGGVDTYSGIMANNDVQVKGVGVKAEFYKRAYMTAVYNVHISKRLLMAHSYHNTTAESYSGFRNRINKYGSFRDTILELVEGSFFSTGGCFLRNSNVLFPTEPCAGSLRLQPQLKMVLRQTSTSLCLVEEGEAKLF